MKIGILTYHCVPNFGAQLQAVSTIGYLKKRGYTPLVIHWVPEDLEKRDRKNVPNKQYETHWGFAEETMPLTRLCRTEEDVIKEIEANNIDGLFVGSDALFKYVPLKDRHFFSKRKLRIIKNDILTVEDFHSNPFWGGFISCLKNRIPAFAYSVSSQNCHYNIMDATERIMMKDHIRNFCGVTVRDEWTQRMIEEITGDNVKITPDPVFAFNQNCYLTIPSKADVLAKFDLNDNYVLVSFHLGILPNSYFDNLYSSITAHGLQPIILPTPEGFKYKGHNKYIEQPLSPIDWYALISYSKGYIGERMHPIVVCLHNNVPFVCFDEYGVTEKHWLGLKRKYIKESSKIFDILEKAGLLENWIPYHGKVPSPQNVVSRLLAFDKSQCSEFSKSYNQYYNKSMDYALQTLEHSIVITNK